MNFPCQWLCMLVAIVTMLAPSMAFALGPWTVTLTPMLDPLPIGYCGAIHLTVLDGAGREVPRNPLGQRVTIADFDLTVTSPDGISVAAHQIDTSHVAACGCQGGVVGSVATVTATYPAQALVAAARVPNVAFQKTATFAVAEKKGPVNPPACLTRADPTISALPTTAPPATLATQPTPTPTTSPVAVALPQTAPPVKVSTEYSPGPVMVSVPLSAIGAWYEPGPVMVGVALSAQGAWYEPAPVTATVVLSATGKWIEHALSPTRPLTPAPPSP